MCELFIKYFTILLPQLRVRAYRSDLTSEEGTTIVRVYITRNSGTPVFAHGDLTYTLSEDQALGVSFGGVEASDSDSVRCVFELSLPNYLLLPCWSFLPPITLYCSTSL